MIPNIFLFLSIVFLLTFLLGKLIEKIHVPWIFAALLLGTVLAVYNPFQDITSSGTFNFLAQLGMYFLLFMVGLEMDINKLRKSGAFIVKATMFIILFEAFFSSILIHYVFEYNWMISIAVSLSFATVGEAILIPILDEFKMINTKLGESIIGIGTLDDILELLSLIFVIVILGVSSSTHLNILLVFGSLILLFLLSYSFRFFKKESQKFTIVPLEVLFLFLIFIFFSFSRDRRTCRFNFHRRAFCGTRHKNVCARKQA